MAEAEAVYYLEIHLNVHCSIPHPDTKTVHTAK